MLSAAKVQQNTFVTSTCACRHDDRVAGLAEWPGRPKRARRALGQPTFFPARLVAGAFSPLRLAGSWTLTSDDPRFGGISALALNGDEFVALTDSGAVVRFPRPGARRTEARIAELPDGPGAKTHKVDRDSEALLRDPLGRGWWVGFETRNQAWLYDLGFTRPLARIAFGERRWAENLGIEGLAGDGSAILLFPEAGGDVVRWDGKRMQIQSVADARGRIADAVRLPDGRLMVLHRRLTPTGFVNALTLLEPTQGGGWTTGRSFQLRGRMAGQFRSACGRTDAGWTDPAVADDRR